MAGHRIASVGGYLLPGTSDAWARQWKRVGASVLITATLLFSSQLALAQFTQQGSKLVGNQLSQVRPKLVAFNDGLV
jgi:hypothetical protein